MPVLSLPARVCTYQEGDGPHTLICLPMTNSEKKNIGIVGGGILGLSLALNLSDRGYGVTVFEGQDEIGGILVPIRIGDYTWDRFYHVILNSDRALLHLMEQLELLPEVKWGPTKTGFYTDGRFHSMSNIVEFLRFPPLSLLDILRLGGTIFLTSRIKSWQRLEKMSVESWLRRLSGRRTFKKVWLPLLKSKLGENYRITNAAFIWATIARMYAARRTGIKQEMFGYIAGTYAKALHRLREELEGRGVKLVCGQPVAKVQQKEDGIEIKLTGKARFTFDAAVFTNPCGEISGLCPDLTESEKTRLGRIKYEHVVCLVLLLRKRLDGYYITNITDQGFPFTTVIEMTALVDPSLFDHCSLVYLPRYLADDDPVMEWDDAAVQASFWGALKSMYSHLGDNDIAASTVTRARFVFPVTTLNYSTEVMPETKTSVKGVFIANSAQIPNGTMNVNELVALSQRKAQEISDQIH
jgi:protoporphyrinogen oxidase